jgi:hypothetical protein
MAFSMLIRLVSRPIYSGEIGRSDQDGIRVRDDRSYLEIYQMVAGKIDVCHFIYLPTQFVIETSSIVRSQPPVQYVTNM